MSAGLVGRGDSVTAAFGPMHVLNDSAVQPDDAVTVLTRAGQCLTLDLRKLRVDVERVAAAEAETTGDYYADLAVELHRLADDVESLAGRGLPDSWSSLDILPRDTKLTDGEKIAVVDAIGQALLGKPGEARKLSGGGYHHKAGGQRGRLTVDIFTSVEGPEKRALLEEVERLRAERDALLAAVEPAAEGGGSDA